MRKTKSFWKKAVAGLLSTAMAAGGAFSTGLGSVEAQAAEMPALTVDFGDTTGDILHGAAGFLYGVSSEDVPTTNTLVPLKPKVLCTKGALGTEHPYGDALDVAKTFLESGGEQVMMYNSNYYGVFGVTANYKEYANVLETIIAPAVVEWKEAWKEDHKDDNLKDVDIDKAIVYIPINEGTPIQGTDTNTAWKAYYEAIKAGDPSATIAGPNSAAYNTQFSGTNMRGHIQYCADNNCMPDIITWHDLQVDKLNGLKWEMQDFKSIWNSTNWTKWKEANHTDQDPEIPQICINEYADFSDCGVPGRLVNWIARLEDEKVYGCLPFWHQANNLNDLTADANEGNGAWWLYKWYGDMSGETVKVSTNTSYEQLYGVASIDNTKQSATTLLGGIDGSANVNLLNVGNTEAFKGQGMVHVKVQATAFSGYHGAQNQTPVIMEGALPVNEDGSVALSLNNMKFSTAYNVTITKVSEGEELTDAMVNRYQKVYEAEQAELGTGCITKGETFNPNYYLSDGSIVSMPQDAVMTYTIEVPVDGKYKLDFIYGNGTGSTRNNMSTHNPQNIMQRFSIDGQEPSEEMMKNTLLENMTGIHTLYGDLSAGTHTIQIQTMGDGTVWHDALTVTWAGAKDVALEKSRDLYEAEQSDFNILLGNTDTTVKTENSISGYSSNGYVTGLDKRTVGEGGGIRWNVVVDESGLYNMTFRYQSAAAGNIHIYTGNTATTLDRLSKTVSAEAAQGQWREATASVYLQKGINVIDADADADMALDYMKVQAVDQGEYPTAIEAEDCIPGGSSIEVRDSSMASGGKYVAGMEGDANAAEDINKYLEIRYNAPQAGVYELQVFQSNNDICGTHSYNTKIIDKYASFQVNGQDPQRYFFINTFSDDTFKEKSIQVRLDAGDNVIKIFNDDSWTVKWGGSQSTPGENVLDNYAPNFDRFILTPLTLDTPIAVPDTYSIQVTTTAAGYATVDKNAVEQGGSFLVTMAPEKGLADVLVDGVSKKDQVQEQGDGAYTLEIPDVQADVQVKVYFEEASGEHRDVYITNAGFGTGNTYGWEASSEDAVSVAKEIANSYEGYYARVEGGSISQTLQGLEAGKYILHVYAKGENTEGEALLCAGETTQAMNLSEEYEEQTMVINLQDKGDFLIKADAAGLTKGTLYLDNFSLERVYQRDESLISQELEYFVDCGDHNPDTLSPGEKFGKRNQVTDQIFGEDIRTGYQWGVVTSEQDQAIAAPSGSKGAYTTYQWANENNKADLQDKETSFRYAHNQVENGINPRYVKYRFQLEPGDYRVTAGMGNQWNNSGNPDVYAGETKLNETPLNISSGAAVEVSGQVTVPQGEEFLDVYALSKDATINMNYITIEKWTEPPKMELAYFTDCGDHDPSTLSEGEEFGYGNSVTEQLYQADPGTARMWGLKVKDSDLDTTGTPAGSKAIFTKYTWADERSTGDNQPKESTFRYARGQDVAFPDAGQRPGIDYGYELENGTYLVQVGIGNPWSNAWRTAITLNGELATDTPTVGIPMNKTNVIEKQIQVTDGNLDIHLSCPDACVTVNYIKIYKLEEAPEEVVLDSIEVTPPAKAEYEIGEELELEGLAVTAKYSDGSQQELEAGSYTLEGFDSETPGQKTITVSYTEGEATKTAEFTVTVKEKEEPDKTLTGITVTPPEKTEYEIGEPFDSTGLKVMAQYSDNTEAEVKDYTVSEVDTCKAGEQKVTVTYQEKTAEFTILVKERVLTGIEVIVPDKTDYLVGEDFDPAGMVVNAVYSNKVKEEVSSEEYTVEGFDSAEAGEQTITVTYQEMKAEFTVNVKEETPEPVLSKVVLTPPVKTEYVVGEALDLTGLAVYAHYSDGSYTELTPEDYQITELDTTVPGIHYVTVTYGEMAAEFMAVVAEAPKPEVTKIEVKAPDKLTYQAGETLDTEGMIVTAYYADGSQEEVTNYTVSELDSSTPGEKTITVTYGEAAAEFTVTVEEAAKSPHWEQDRNGWWYNNGDGTWPKNTWKLIDGDWYYFDKYGYRAEGWVLDGKTWYYCDENGVMQTGWLQLGSTWYYLKNSGAMATGWLQDGTAWYYLKNSGAMATGWTKVGSTWYYLKSNGVMATGWLQDGNTWYYLKSSGAMASGWVLDGNTWYYLKNNGAMVTGWAKVGSAWYYLKSSGAMATGWVKVGNTWYYLRSSGAMATSTWIGNYYVDSSGAWTKTR